VQSPPTIELAPMD